MMGVIPSTHTAGDTFEAIEAYDSYPASDGWIATLLVRIGGCRIKVGSAADGDSHVFSATAAETAPWQAGRGQAWVVVEKGAVRHTARSPFDFQVWPDPSSVSATLTALEDQLAKCDAAIAGVLAGKGIASYTFATQAGQRSAQRMSLEELRAHRNWVSDRLEQERARQQGRPPRGGWRRIRTKFSR